MKFYSWLKFLGIVLGGLAWFWGGLVQAEVIVKIEIRGNQVLEEETIRMMIGSREGGEYTPEQITDDIHALYASGCIRDVVVESRPSEDPEHPGVIVTYYLLEKPILREVRFEGVKAISKDELTTISNLKPRSVYDPAKVREIRSRLLEEYAKRGYFMARVEVEVVEVAPNQVDVIFRVNEGNKPSVQEVHFFGNHEMSDRQLRRRMATKPEGVFTAQKYSREDFLRDQYVLDFYYEDNGYLEAAFTPAERILTEDRQHVILGLGIDEGPQYRTGEIKLTGDLLLPEAELKKGLLLKTGEVFRKSFLIRDHQSLVDFYGREGYALCEIAPELKLDREKREVVVIWHIRKGTKVYVERIEITGNHNTYDKVIRRQLTLKEGQLFSTAEVRRSEARIQQLGYFSEVQIIPRPGSEPNRINLEVAVKERRSGAFSAGAGVSTASEYFFSLQYQQQNFLGLGMDVAVQALISDRTQTYYLQYADPYFLDSDWYLAVNLFSTETYYIRFVDRREGGSVTLGRRLPHFEHVRFYATYSYLITDLQSFQDSATIYRQQPSNTAIGSLSLILDRNALNNNYDPTAGSRMISEVEIAGQGIFGGDNDFIKTRLEAWYFMPVYHGTYLAFHSRLRWMSYEQDDRLLISERYFQGGARSLRGYEVASVSPMFREDNGDLTPIGGNKDALFTVEYIFPFAAEMGLKFVVFYDAGNVFNDNQDMDLGNLRKDWGFGLRWISPMGPLRFELAFPVDRRKEDDPQQFVFTVGTLF